MWRVFYWYKVQAISVISLLYRCPVGVELEVPMVSDTIFFCSAASTGMVKILYAIHRCNYYSQFKSVSIERSLTINFAGNIHTDYPCFVCDSMNFLVLCRTHL